MAMVFLSRSLRLGVASMATCASLALGGCGVNRVVANADMSADGRERHPILLAEGTHSVDTFPVFDRGRLDHRTASQIRDFGARYRALGDGGLTILVPQGGRSGWQASAAVPAMREALERAAGRPVAVAAYPVADPGLVAPVRLTFGGIKAKVAHRCGDWPDDLASASSLRGWQNETYWNFGCANQSMIAAQVADPRDLAAQRGEQPTDTAFRIRAITNVRDGRDPGTEWKNTNTSIGNVGGSK